MLRVSDQLWLYNSHIRSFHANWNRDAISVSHVRIHFLGCLNALFSRSKNPSCDQSTASKIYLQTFLQSWRSCIRTWPPQDPFGYPNSFFPPWDISALSQKVAYQSRSPWTKIRTSATTLGTWTSKIQDGEGVDVLRSPDLNTKRISVLQCKPQETKRLMKNSHNHETFWSPQKVCQILKQLKLS